MASVDVRPPTGIELSHIRLKDRSWRSYALWWALYLVFRLKGFPRPPPKKGPQVWDFPPPVKQTPGCSVEQWTTQGWTCTVLKPSTSSKPLTRQIIFFHGGVFMVPVMSMHYTMCATLACELDAEVIMVPTPLSPANGVDDVLPVLTRVYEDVLSRANGREIILAGDSSGGNLSLILTFAAHDAKLPLPHQLLLSSPFVDLALDNPDIAQYLPNDPVFRPPTMRADSLRWVRGSENPTPATKEELKQVKISPLYGDYSILAAAGTAMVVSTATYDILHPDTMLMVEKAQKAGVRTTLVEGVSYVHGFQMLTGILPEADKATELMLIAVKGNSPK